MKMRDLPQRYRVRRDEEWLGRGDWPPPPWCVCVPLGFARGKNAADKGVSERFVVPLGLARRKKAVDTPRLRSGQEGLSGKRVDSEPLVVGRCENTPSCGEKVGRN